MSEGQDVKEINFTANFASDIMDLSQPLNLEN